MKNGHDNWYKSYRIEEAAYKEFEARAIQYQDHVDFTWLVNPDGIPTTSDDGFCRRQGGGGSAKVIEEKFAAAQEKPALYRPESGIRRHY